MLLECFLVLIVIWADASLFRTKNNLNLINHNGVFILPDTEAETSTETETEIDTDNLTRNLMGICVGVCLCPV